MRNKPKKAGLTMRSYSALLGEISGLDPKGGEEISPQRVARLGLSPRAVQRTPNVGLRSFKEIVAWMRRAGYWQEPCLPDEIIKTKKAEQIKRGKTDPLIRKHIKYLRRRGFTVTRKRKSC